ncbi:MAG: hypothetical protein IPG45_01575 [Deltaproteobacteria bacterium]|nr:hypothetical protein [Deltaproteobacteria bacterium]
MRSRCDRCLGLLLLAIGCTAEPRWLGWPESDAGALVLAYQDGQGLYAVAFPRRSGDRIELEVPGLERGTALWALSYAQPLGELGLPEGRLENSRPEACGARPLPSDGEAYQAQIDEASSQWLPLTEWPPALRDFHFAGPCVCPVLEVERVLALGQGTLQFGITDRPGKLLLLDREARTLHDLDADGRGPSRASVGAGGLTALERAGETWVTSGRGIQLGRLPGELRTLLPAADVGVSADLAPGRPGEVWVSTSSAVIGRISEDRGFEPVFRWDGPTGAIYGVIIAGQSGQLWATVTYEPFLFELSQEDGRLLRRIPITLDDRSITALADLPGLGVVIATDRGRFFVYDGTNILDLAELPTTLAALRIVPTPFGFLTFNKSGGIASYSPGTGLCDGGPAFAQHRFSDGALLDGRPVLVGVDSQGQASAFFLR